MMSHRSKGIHTSLRGGLLLCLVMLMVNGTSAKASDFVSQVDLQPLEELAVHTEGRLNSFGSHANALMQEVTGSKRIDGRAPLYTYLDMLFRPKQHVQIGVERCPSIDALRTRDLLHQGIRMGPETVQAPFSVDGQFLKRLKIDLGNEVRSLRRGAVDHQHDQAQQKSATK